MLLTEDQARDRVARSPWTQTLKDLEQFGKIQTKVDLDGIKAHAAPVGSEFINDTNQY